MSKFCDCGQRLNMHEDFYCRREELLEEEAYGLNECFDRIPYIPTDQDFLPIEKIRG